MGISGAIAWAFKAVIDYLYYLRVGEEYWNRQKNRWFWRLFGISFGVAVLIRHFSEKKEEDASTSKKSEKEKN